MVPPLLGLQHQQPQRVLSRDRRDERDRDRSRIDHDRDHRDYHGRDRSRDSRDDRHRRGDRNRCRDDRDRRDRDGGGRMSRWSDSDCDRQGRRPEGDNNRSERALDVAARKAQEYRQQQSLGGSSTGGGDRQRDRGGRSSRWGPNNDNNPSDVGAATAKTNIPSLLQTPSTQQQQVSADGDNRQMVGRQLKSCSLKM